MSARICEHRGVTPCIDAVLPVRGHLLCDCRISIVQHLGDSLVISSGLFEPIRKPVGRLHAGVLFAVGIILIDLIHNTLNELRLAFRGHFHIHPAHRQRLAKQGAAFLHLECDSAFTGRIATVLGCFSQHIRLHLAFRSVEVHGSIQQLVSPRLVAFRLDVGNRKLHVGLLVRLLIEGRLAKLLLHTITQHGRVLTSLRGELAHTLLAGRWCGSLRRRSSGLHGLCFL